MFFAEFNEEEEARLRGLFQEDPGRIRRDLEHLREWLEKQPHLPHDVDEGTLLNFLRGRNYSLEKTKDRLDKFFTYKGILPEFYSHLDPLSPDIKKSMEKQVYCGLPGYTPQGYRVFVYSYKGTDVESFDYNMIIKRAVCSYSLVLSADILHKATVLIVDSTEITAGHATKISISQIKKTIALAQEALPHKFRKVFLLGLSPLLVKLTNICLQFVKENLRNRVVILEGKNLEPVYEVIPRKMLPDEYGGSAGSIFDLNKRWSKELVGRREWLVQLGEKKADEAKRPGKPKTATELLGIEGSFRKLDVD